VNDRFGSSAAPQRRLPSRSVYPRNLPILLRCRSRQDRAMCRSFALPAKQGTIECLYAKITPAAEPQIETGLRLRIQAHEEAQCDFVCSLLQG
jgi:hypothetical protein